MLKTINQVLLLLKVRKYWHRLKPHERLGAIEILLNSGQTATLEKKLRLAFLDEHLSSRYGTGLIHLICIFRDDEPVISEAKFYADLVNAVEHKIYVHIGHDDVHYENNALGCISDVVNFFGFFLPTKHREEWIGDLRESLHQMVSDGYSRTSISVVAAGRIVLLIWSMICLRLF